MTKLWQKNTAVHLDPLIEKYTVADDLYLDLILMPYDIEASLAHAQMLEKIGILTTEEHQQLQAAFEKLKLLYKQNQIQIKVSDEDGHSFIENFLLENCGKVGKKIHSGRSRNDQSLVALRLYMKDVLFQIRASSLDLAVKLLKLAKKYQNIPLPGYTHTKQAMLSSVGHYLTAYLESVLDDIACLDSCLLYIDKNPLGSAASFGVSFPLDREMTTELLDFAAIQINSLYCQNSRGKVKGYFLESLDQVMLSLNKMATDMIFFAADDLGFFDFGHLVTTGSSIMPQKRNLDGLEVLRSYRHVIAANQQLVKSINSNLISGYHRDFQLIKKPLIESSEIVLDSLKVMGLYLDNLIINEEQIKSHIKTYIFMADLANDLVVNEGMSFRDAYRRAYDEIDDYEVDFQKNLKSKISLGAPGNLALDRYEERLAELELEMFK